MPLFKKLMTAIKESFSPPVFHVKKAKRGRGRFVSRRKTVKRVLPKKRPAAKKKAARKKIFKPKKPPRFARKRPPLPVKQKPKEAPSVLIGEVTHYFSKIGVCVIKLSGDLRVGDRLRIKRPGSSFPQVVRSLQIENENVSAARRGELVGLKIDTKAGEGDKVFKLL